MQRRALCHLLVALTTTACAGATHSAASEPSSAPVASADPPPPSEEPHLRPPGPPTRAEIERWLADGLGALLARITVSPVVDDRGAFRGFRLDAARDLGAWQASGMDVRAGDVILRVNGIHIVRPEHALWAFERLRIASGIEVELVRSGHVMQVRSPIIDNPVSVAARP